LGWALAAIGGPGTTAGPVVLSLGLGLSVLAAVGQIDSNLRGAIARDLPTRAPSYFFVDIQKDQMPKVLDRLENDPAVSGIDSAPMLRGIISQINGRPAEEVAGGHWVIEGDRGITYAATLPDRTKLVAGEWWDPEKQGTPQVSFAADEAEEMGLKLGDMLTLNILGRDIEAEITSLREVDFSTAGMGFIMVMNPAAIEAAPHTFIATVHAEEEAEAQILRDLSSRFPNITAIRVRDAINQVSDLLAGLASATTWGAAATLLTGFLVLIGAAAADQSARTREAAILKTLGATRAHLLTSLALRAALLGAAAGIVALAAGLTGGWAVSHFVMETEFSIDWASALTIIIGGALISLMAGLGFAWGPLRARPARILRARE
jgi:putative ABC transport system permease protein